jgi:NDP-sugar pyrophosphorylase family protein
MVAYLLCAGFGTRMRPLTQETPKSLLRVAGRPFLDALLDEMEAWAALDAIHVAVNHRDAAAFRAWARRHRAHLSPDGPTLHVYDDGVESPQAQLGVVGDLGFLLQHAGLPPGGALVSGGDSLYRFPLAPLLNAYDGSVNQVLALYEPSPERRAHSSCLHLDGTAVTDLVDASPDRPRNDPPHRICPSWALLRPDALRRVDAYLSAGEPPDRLGAFLNHVAHEHELRALRLPKQADLRFHCNTVDELERARRRLHDEPRHVLSPETVRECLGGA